MQPHVPTSTNTSMHREKIQTYTQRDMNTYMSHRIYDLYLYIHRKKHYNTQTYIHADIHSYIHARRHIQ